MSLFQASVLNKFLSSQDESIIKKAYQDFEGYFLNDEIQKNIRNSKEEQFQEGFLRELFVKILGYTISPEPNYNLTTELKNVRNSKKTDGAILKDGKALAVLELKSTNTKDLNKVTEQAFNYKNNQPGCDYVVTSNFERLRFYIHNAVEFEEFNLFNLSYEDFRLLWILLQKDNLLGVIPQRIKEESVHEEEKVTKNLYRDYSLFKNDLWKDLCLNNPHLDELVLYKQSQRILDRFLFIFFTEDKGILPPNVTTIIVDQWNKLKELDEYQTLYSRFVKFFGYLNSGYSGANYTIPAFNGGLFKPDPVLNGLKLSDAVLEKHVLKMTDYDFDTEVDTNILGHIFEHSLNDIENVRAQLAGEEVDKSKTKRKKDGVFYTPKYITKYIVDNTVGKLCEEKKAEIGIDEEEFAKDRKGRRTDTLKKLDAQLKEYREWLLQLTICDPACGSGAFLNQALEFLMAEHRYVDELESHLLGYAMVFPDVENHILERNIYGVDINEESVEIARLSLWLRTAKKGRKLTSLSSNIKVGNSLIDDPEVAGELAFNWQEQFPTVFEKGGFDVVIGNPPYVHLEAIKDVSDQLSKLGYETFDRRGDLYPLFVEKGMNILRPDGAISFIMPNKWLQAGYGKNLREYFLKHHLVQLIDFGDFQIFEGATTYPCIFISRNASPQKTFSVSVLKSASAIDFESHVSAIAETFNTDGFSGDTWVITSKKEKEFLLKINQSTASLASQLAKGTFRGILTGLSEAFLISSEIKEDLIKKDINSASFIFPFLQGRDVKQYVAPEAQNYLLLFPKGYTQEQIGKCDEEDAWNWLNKTYPAIADWLSPFKERGEKRTDKGDYWWEVRACDYYTEFDKPKIMYQAFQVKPCFVYDETGLYCNNSMWIIPTDKKALVGVLNSKMGWWLINKYCTQIQNGCQLIWKYFGQIPVPNLDMAIDLENASANRIEQTASYEGVASTFLQHFQSKFPIDKPSKKLQNWPELDFKGFLAELKKKKIKLSLDEEAEWMQYFNKKISEANALQAEIDRIDKQIDQLVYELYGLTDEEIAIVEQA